jgi:nicotinamidase/pyrazinamidase
MAVVTPARRLLDLRAAITMEGAMLANASPAFSRRLFLGSTAAACFVAIGPARAAGTIKPGPKSALIVVDVQNCFIDGGTLPVKGGAAVVPVINKLAASFENIVVTQDWHTPGHASFASTHAGKKPFETTSMPYGTQVLWPDHCVQGSDDAALHRDLKLPTAGLIIRKGSNKNVDSYSAFIEADAKTMTGLAGYLKERGVNTVFVTGLATDFCVAWTAMDARKLGFTAYVIEDATRAIDLNGSLAAAWKQMTEAGVKRIQSSDIA